MQFRIKKWKRRDIILLLERLELYVSSGLPIDEALKISAEGISKRQKNDMEKVSGAVSAGGLLSYNLTKFIGISDTTTGLIENGELSGDLSRALLSARSLLEREDELLKKCTSAMTYPVVIGLFAVMLTIGLVRGVMPQIIPMLKSLNVSLPLLTRTTIAFSDNLTMYGIQALLVGIICLIIFSVAYKKIKFVRKIFQAVLMKIPITGTLLRNYAVVVFLRSCGSLIESGLPVTKAYEKTVFAVSFLPLKEVLLSDVSNISRGVSLGNIISNKNLPPYIAPLLHAGEISGTLGTSLLRAATILDRDIEHSLRRLTSLIEPIMMAGMGCVVGAIALSIMMPIYNISKVLQR
ncbi:MAG: type II secretion system F family protein [Candidatus Paceibacterota bacterium]|jgi:type IV pilus assembly protein PilC